jgi:hypothetical protein
MYSPNPNPLTAKVAKILRKVRKDLKINYFDFVCPSERISSGRALRLLSVLGG